jgi:ABC-type multidrug transport system fused ATPase/permease subunit
MSTVLDHQPRKRRRGRRTYFWRATRYLFPYKKLVIVSIVCAVFAGGIFFSGLGALFPVLQTLLNGDTPRMWVDRTVAEARWEIDLDDEPGDTVILKVEPGGAGEQAGFAAGDSLNEMDVSKLAADGPAVGAPRRLLRSLVYLLPPSPVGAVAVIMFGVFLLSMLANAIRFVQEFLSNKAALSAVNDLRSDLYGHALRTPLSYYGRVGTGDITSRILADSGQMQEGFRTLLGRAVQEPIFAVFALAFALWLDWRLTLFVVGFAPVMAVVLRKFGTKMRRASRATLQNSSSLLAQINATLAGVRVVKANNAEEHEQRRLGGILSRLLGVQLRLVKYDAMSTPVMETLAVLAVGVVITVAVYFVRVDNSLSAASAILIFGCLVQVAESLRRVSKLNIILQKANAAGERIFEALDLPEEVGGTRRSDETTAREEPKGSDPGFETSSSPSRCLASSPLRVHSEVGFENVTFAYAPEQPPALEDVTLTVAKGESVAVVGRNGSGKTTLLSLLPRFYDPDQGRVTIDGTDVRTLPLHALRELIGIVTQEAVVFPGSIAENIAYAKPDVPLETIQAAAKQAEAHEFILAKPGGYDFELSGLGGQLSGGQRQRLNIARAILRDPPILILDEATSQVDAESEGLIQQAIGRLMRGRTTFVIAHRFSTILDCDRIAVMEAGRLEAVGTHGELLETCELYRTLYDRQLVGA